MSELVRIVCGARDKSCRERLGTLYWQDGGYWLHVAYQDRWWQIPSDLSGHAPMQCSKPTHRSAKVAWTDDRLLSVFRYEELRGAIATVRKRARRSGALSPIDLEWTPW